MIERFLKQTTFTSVEDYNKNLKFIIPEQFNFAYDVMDAWAEEKPDAHTVYKNTHAGQEFNMVLEGKMELYIGGKTIVLEEGDSIYFDSSKPHGMLAVGDKAVKFLAFTVE